MHTFLGKLWLIVREVFLVLTAILILYTILGLWKLGQNGWQNANQLIISIPANDFLLYLLIFFFSELRRPIQNFAKQKKISYAAVVILAILATVLAAFLVLAGLDALGLEDSILLSASVFQLGAASVAAGVFCFIWSKTAAWIEKREKV